MKIFQCENCEHSLFFENFHCENCGHFTGYRDTDRRMLSFPSVSELMVSDGEGAVYTYCKNKEYEVCNWLVDPRDAHDFCTACQLNRTIPNLSDEDNFEKWRSLEVAKHRLIYQLQKLGLPLRSKLVDADGLCFDFIVQDLASGIVTGHAGGVVTILISEADSVVREQMRKQFREPYRTLIGHLRHEVGHYFWDRLVSTDEEVLGEFRAVFGDERLDYGEALQTYYDEGAPADWQNAFISKYATSHAWEDWAETWAHYLHIMDMVETAYFFGISVDPVATNTAMRAEVSFDPYHTKEFKSILQTCIPLSYAVNSINRAMGISDVYPFVISPPVRKKLTFIHKLLRKLR